MSFQVSKPCPNNVLMSSTVCSYPWSPLHGRGPWPPLHCIFHACNCRRYWTGVSVCSASKLRFKSSLGAAVRNGDFQHVVWVINVTTCNLKFHRPKVNCQGPRLADYLITSILLPMPRGGRGGFFFTMSFFVVKVLA